MAQKVIFTNEVAQALEQFIAEFHPHSTMILVDTNTRDAVLPRLTDQSELLRSLPVIVTPAGDVNKNIESLTAIWTAMQQSGANRHSMLINLGGGMVTDMGGFAAATFKRGIKFINVPTTLLSAVDAAVGGKTGINFNGLKNEVGAFAPAQAVLISTAFLSTLPDTEILSGYAEMLKHGLIDSPEHYAQLIDFDPTEGSPEHLLTLLERSVKVKERIVLEDPFEHGIRRALNLGHTVGHAFESLAMRRNRPVPHGYAVAWGCIVELILSHMQLGFPSAVLHGFADYVGTHYGALPITCDDYPELLELMHHDKKNTGSDINFTLLKNIGEIYIDRTCDEDSIASALDIFRDMLHI